MRRPGVIYNPPVTALFHTAMAVLTWLFFLGSAGSMLVILISFAEDLKELLGKE